LIVRRGSGRGLTAGNRWAGQPLQKQAFVPVSRPSGLRSLSAGLATSLLRSIAGRVTRPFSKTQKRGRTDALHARRPVRSSATTSACVRSSRASHRRQTIARSPVVLPGLSALSQNPGDHLFVWADGRVAFVSSCLRVCDGFQKPPLCILCVSEPLW